MRGSPREAGGSSEERIVFVEVLDAFGVLLGLVVPQHVAFRYPHEVLPDRRQKGRLPARVAPVVLKGPSDRDRLFGARERNVEFARVLLFGFGGGTLEEGVDAVAGVGDDDVLKFEALGLVDGREKDAVATTSLEQRSASLSELIWTR